MASYKDLNNKLQKNKIGIFIILIIVLCIYFVYVKISNDYSTTLSNEPLLIYGNHNGKIGKIINGIEFKESSNTEHGIEMSYSFWLKINSWDYNKDQWKHLFHKGNDIGIPLQSPGFWLYPYENKLAINMNTYFSVKESCDIDNIPVNKWIHITYILINKNIDIYINSKLRKRCELKGLPKLNFGDLYISQFGGFDGNLSQLRYFNYAIPVYKIEKLFNEGPLLIESSVEISDSNVANTVKLSDNWHNSGSLPNNNSFVN
jgi:hypothetical protein